MKVKDLSHFFEQSIKSEKEQKTAIKVGIGSNISTNGLSIVSPANTVIFVEEKDKKEMKNDDPEENVQDSPWNDAAYINGLHLFSVIGVCIILSSPVILIPQHDAIQFKEYWYEILMTFCYHAQWK